jgi:MFS family permease
VTASASRARPATAAAWNLRPWAVVAQGAAALAVSMGIGRFVYTPILPLMVREAGLSTSYGATLATANYAGYLLGALAGILAPSLIRSPLVMRAALVTTVVTLALMPATDDYAAWFVLRFVAGVTSALVFMFAVSAMLALLQQSHHLVGWGFGGVGAGIALSGVLVLVAGSFSTWSAAWWSSALAAVLLSGVAWRLRPAAPDGQATPSPSSGGPPVHRWFTALFVSYSLEGVGYIIAGTFLVAAVARQSPGWAGSGAWIVVGICALPAPAIWSALGHRWTRPSLLVVALLLQVIGIGLPAVAGGVAPALVGAALFGLTFLGIASLVLALGAYLQFPRAIALLTTGYSIGQILGPEIVKPLLRNGYHDALLVGAAVVLAAALAAAVLRVGFPLRVGAALEPSRAHQFVPGPGERGGGDVNSTVQTAGTIN